jgi:two-component system, sensor histidine kinase PdtaS
MALIHQILYVSKDFGRADFSAFLDTLIPVLMSSYGVDPDRIALSVNAAEVHMPIGIAVPCGLIVNELISNAFKHGFPDGRRGEVRIGLDGQDDGRATLVVSDDGVGIAKDLDVQDGNTFGLQLVMLLAEQLGGELTIERANPTRFQLQFPMQR